jgi:hypothetical protein
MAANEWDVKDFCAGNKHGHRGIKDEKKVNF